MKMLEAFAGNFYDLHHFNAYIRTTQAANSGLRSYILSLGVRIEFVEFDEFDDRELKKDSKVVNIGSFDDKCPLLLPVDIGELYISQIWEGKPFCEIFVSSTATSLGLFRVLGNYDLEIRVLVLFIFFMLLLHLSPKP
ncbi:NB-ARC domain containing protein [Quillaja saponaria]|uniref:NB-ARC domain containing protein n=1 Tax=Quillaja saponaria TaxID=32244 RepID=A0AAD7KNQ0_QUISA|nr:NB-ARC domain containing protein [Quillaja saponaria]